MTQVVVLLPIKVPSGNYCWHSPSQSICSKFSNDGGHPVCDLSLGNLDYDDSGFVCKPTACLVLKVEENSGCAHRSPVPVGNNLLFCIDCGKTISG